MLTVTVELDASGKKSTRAPFSRRYSVTPSIAATFSVAWTIAGLPARSPSTSQTVFRIMSNYLCSNHPKRTEHSPQRIVSAEFLNPSETAIRVLINAGARAVLPVRAAVRFAVAGFGVMLIAFP